MRQKAAPQQAVDRSGRRPQFANRTGRAMWLAATVAGMDEVGRQGEDLAAAFLGAAGLAILARNWRCRAGELDIVARDGRCVVFCEVKTRRSDAFGGPAAAVDNRKAARVRRLAVQWLTENRPGTPVVRFDVVTVVPARAGGAAVIEHFRDAF